MLFQALFQLYILALALCAFPVEAQSSLVRDRYHRGLNFRRENGTTEHKMQVPKLDKALPAQNLSMATAPIANVTTSLIPILTPPLRSMVEFYICTAPKLDVVEVDSCISTVSPKPNSMCSTVLNGFFTKITVTDCSQSVTFYKTGTMVMATATGLAFPSSESSIQARQLTSTSPVKSSSKFSTAILTPKIYVQKVMIYYVSPWQAVAANEPSDITVVTCRYDEYNVRKCRSVKQVWATYTKYVTVTKTSTISVATSFSEVSSTEHPFS
jgi:hypothetical protein